MNKRIIAASAALALAFSLSACSDKEEKSSEAKEAKTTTTSATTTVTTAESSSAVEDSSSEVSSSIEEDVSDSSEQSMESEIPDLKISSDWTDGEFAFDGRVITLNSSTVSEISSDWTMVKPFTRQEEETTGGEKYPDTIFQSDEYTNIYNDWYCYAGTNVTFDIDGVSPECTWDNAVLTGVYINARWAVYFDSVYPETMFPGQIMFGSSKEKIIDAYGTPDDTLEITETDAIAYKQMVTDFSTNSEEKANVEKNFNEDDFITETLIYTADDKQLSFTVTQKHGLIEVMLKTLS